jgi:hypothetical protein
MPLIIGQLNARIDVDSTSPPPAAAPAEALDDEAARLRALSAERFDRERRIEQRDPDRLGGS